MTDDEAQRRVRALEDKVEYLLRLVRLLLARIRAAEQASRAGSGR